MVGSWDWLPCKQWVVGGGRIRGNRKTYTTGGVCGRLYTGILLCWGYTCWYPMFVLGKIKVWIFLLIIDVCHKGTIWPQHLRKTFLRLIFFPSLPQQPIFPIKCWVLNKGTIGTIFIMSLVWRGPWLGIEPGTSRTRSQHSYH